MSLAAGLPGLAPFPLRSAALGGRFEGGFDETRADVLTSIRSMNRRDAGAVAVLSGQLGYPSTAADIERRFRTIEGATDSQAWVAEVEPGTIIGWLQVSDTRHLESDSVAEVVGLVVADGQRGKGVGRALMAAAEQWANGRGHNEVIVRSNVVRGDAHEFYKRLGYAIVKSQYKFRKKLPLEVNS